MNPRRLLVLLIILAAPSFSLAQDGDSVFRNITDERLEGIMRGLRIDFKQTSSNKGTTIWTYDRNNFKMRLFNFDGKDLMIDAEFGPTTWEVINNWNTQAKFTRSVMRKDNKGEFSLLESNFDLLGGVTEGAVKQFFNNFDVDVKAFSTALTATVTEEEVFRVVSAQRVEGLLKTLNVQFKKQDGKNDFAAYSFDYNKSPMELTNFSGKDLMMAARFPSAPLDKVNKWNLDRKFIRAVLYPGQGEQPGYVALESNLDCAAGCTESMLRSFVTTFELEVREFGKFLKK